MGFPRPEVAQWGFRGQFWGAPGVTLFLPTTQSKVGILAMLDEECLRPGTVNEDTFITKLNQIFASHKRYESKETLNAKHITDVSLPLRCFRIHHYAGKVQGTHSPIPGDQQGTQPSSQPSRGAGAHAGRAPTPLTLTQSSSHPSYGAGACADPAPVPR